MFVADRCTLSCAGFGCHCRLSGGAENHQLHCYSIVTIVTIVARHTDRRCRASSKTSCASIHVVPTQNRKIGRVLQDDERNPRICCLACWLGLSPNSKSMPRRMYTFYSITSKLRLRLRIKACIWLIEIRYHMFMSSLQRKK
jgi:hypothetical protein